MKRFIAIGVLFLGVSITVLCGQPVKDTGTYRAIIVDTNGTPVPEVFIRLKGTETYTISGKQGKIRFEGLEAGTYVLTIDDFRYRALTKKVFVRPGKISRDTVTVVPAGGELDPVMISDTLLKDSGDVSLRDVAVLKGDQKDRNPSVSLGEQVKDVPGVQTIGTGSQIGKPVIRGLQGNRIKIAYNGIPVDFHQFGVRHGPTFDPFHAGALKVRQGGDVVNYGSGAMGGVVNFISPEIPSDTGEEFFTSGKGVTGYATNNQEQMAGFRLKGGHKNTGFTGSVSRRVGANIRTPQVPTASETGNAGDPRFSGELDHTGFSQWSANGGLGYHSDKTTAFLRGYHWQNEHDLLLPDGSGIGQFLSQDIVQAGGNVEVDSQWTVSAKGTWYRTGRQSNAPGFTREDFPEKKVLDLTINSYQGNVVLSHYRDNGMEALGVMYEHQKQTSTGDAALVPAGDRKTAAIYYNTQRNWGNWRLQAGGRWSVRQQEAVANRKLALPDVSSGETENVLEQRYTAWALEAGLGYMFPQGMRLSLNFNKGYRFPSFFDLHSYGVHGGIAAFQKGDPTLEPEEFLGGDISAVWAPEDLRIKVTGYAQYVDHYIYLANTGFDSSLTDLPVLETRQEGAVIKGVKGGYSWKALSWLRLSGKAEVIWGAFQHRDGELPLLPPGHVSKKLHVHLPRPSGFKNLYLEAEGEFYASKDAAGRYEPFWQFDKNDAFGAASTDAYALLHVRAGGSIEINGKAFDWLVAAENLLNTPYRNFLDTYKGYALGQGRNIRFQLMVPFGNR